MEEVHSTATAAVAIGLTVYNTLNAPMDALQGRYRHFFQHMRRHTLKNGGSCNIASRYFHRRVARRLHSLSRLSRKPALRVCAILRVTVSAYLADSRPVNRAAVRFLERTRAVK